MLQAHFSIYLLLFGPLLPLQVYPKLSLMPAFALRLLKCLKHIYFHFLNWVLARKFRDTLAKFHIWPKNQVWQQDIILRWCSFSLWISLMKLLHNFTLSFAIVPVFRPSSGSCMAFEIFSSCKWNLTLARKKHAPTPFHRTFALAIPRHNLWFKTLWSCKAMDWP